MSRTLSQGMTGPDVKALQDVLNFHIRRGQPIRVDGVFGPKTKDRLVEFQRANRLKTDGLAGPKSNAQLFEETDVPVPLIFIPSLRLTPPNIGGAPGLGIQPPRLIPPLQWPGPPVPPPVPFIGLQSFSLAPNSLAILPELTGPANALGLTITVPTRKDPEDPTVESRRAIIELIDELPATSKFKAFLTSQVPNPVTRISAPSSGFKWGVDPLFDPINPTGFGVKGNTQFMVRLTDGGNGLPNMVFGAWGDGKFFLNFNTQNGQARPTVQAEGQVFVGIRGVFF